MKNGEINIPQSGLDVCQSSTRRPFKFVRGGGDEYLTMKKEQVESS
jgi:hypothetical protein